MVIKGLKHLLVPHHGNGHRPHVLRTPAVRAILAFVVLVEAIFLLNVFLLPTGHFFAAVLSSVMIAETNHHRASGALADLAVNPLLEEAAKRKAQDMAQKGYFSHVAPDGSQPWVWLKNVGYYYLSAGENLAVNFVDSKDVTDAWMTSPGHRANILNGRFTEIGIGTAEGVYKGKNTIFVVQFFGLPYEPLEYLAETKIVDERTDESPAVLPTALISIPTSVPKTVVTPTTPVQKPVVTPPPVTPVTPAPRVETPLFTTTPVSPATGSVAVLGSETEVHTGAIVEGEPTMLEFLMTNPRKTTLGALMILAALVLFALFLTLVSYMRSRHADLVINSLALLAVVLCVVIANDYLSASQLLIQ